MITANKIEQDSVYRFKDIPVVCCHLEQRITVTFQRFFVGPSHIGLFFSSYSESLLYCSTTYIVDTSRTGEHESFDVQYNRFRS